MKEKGTFYVTTPIYYPNDIPHIGHAYTTLAADVLARWNKLNGKQVFFLTGTDEHGKKMEETAKKVGKKPKEFVDELIPQFKSAWEKLNIKYDKFIRTTDKSHENVVQEMLQKCFDNGDIYLGEYAGLYCVGCEAYYTEKDLLEGNICPIHKKSVEKIKEASYFFKLSKYQDKLLKFYKENPNFILPKERANFIINRVKEEGLKDLSISRTTFNWGIPLPFDKKHVCYVWFDALFNYYSATTEKSQENFWPANVHLIGKDIIWFHTVYWPAFLMSTGIELPKSVFAHGWWTFDKEKISKSVGKVINVDQLISIAGVDSARYFLFRNTAFGQDGDFSETSLIERHNNELANKLGNLVSRVSALAEKYELTKTENKLLKKLSLGEIQDNFNNYEFDKALNNIFTFIDICNEYVQSTKPWETGDKKILYELADSLKAIAILLSPIIPETSEKISKVFNFEITYDEIDKPLKISKIVKAPILFNKIELPDLEKVSPQKEPAQKINKPSIPGIMTMSEVQYSDWEKIQLVVGQIEKVEDLEGADKLYKLQVNIGDEVRTVCAGIKKHYSKEDLQWRKVILFKNLTPRKLKGVESKGMLLAAISKDESKVVLISPSADIEVGSIIR